LDDATIGLGSLAVRNVSNRDIRSQRVETILRDISSSNDRIESELNRLNNTNNDILPALLLNQSIMMEMTNKIADLVSKVIMRSMGPVMRPSVRESSLLHQEVR
jgi:hypothetical protein